MNARLREAGFKMKVTSVSLDKVHYLKHLSNDTGGYDTGDGAYFTTVMRPQITSVYLSPEQGC
jgi:hypothetical protein